MGEIKREECMISLDNLIALVHVIHAFTLRPYAVLLPVAIVISLSQKCNAS
jgi:hypothetical protein